MCRCRRSSGLAGGEGLELFERVNAILLSPQGGRDWPLRFYSRELLFSKEARLGWVEPDLAALPVESGHFPFATRHARLSG